MRKSTIVIVSALVALMFVRPASAGPGDVTFTDVPGDLGHPVYSLGGEHHTLAMVPAAYWPDASPVGSAEYLDMVGGAMSVDAVGVITATLTVLSPLTEESVLPEGIKAVWWTWFFSKDTSIFSADYSVHVCWDGSAVDGFVLVRGLDDPVRPVISASAAECSISVVFDGALVEGSVGWFAESICWNHATPHTTQGYLPSAGWFAADITDGPFLPWMKMPTCDS